MQRRAETVAAYLAGLPDDRRRAIAAIRDVILENLPEGYSEGMAYGMIGYHVPHSVYPAGYHCDPSKPVPFASLASQKNHMALYLTCLYGDPEFEAWFRDAWSRAGKKLDGGKSCVRFRKLEDVPLDVVGRAIRKVPVRKFLAFYEASLPGAAGGGHRAPARKKAAAKKAPARAPARKRR